MEQVLRREPEQNGATPHAARKTARGNGVNKHYLTERIPQDRQKSFSLPVVEKGQKDGRGSTVRHIFVRRSSYTIYESDERVIVQYSSDLNEARKQIGRISKLAPMRDRLKFLAASCSRGNLYRVQIADAFHLALEGQLQAAREILEVALDDCAAMQASKGRLSYLSFAVPFAIVMGSVFFLMASPVALPVESLAKVQGALPESFRHMLLAAGGGAVGALLSVAQAIRGRTVETDGYRIANILDGALRILVGIISGGILYLFLSSGLFAGDPFSAGATPTPGSSNSGWHAIVLAGIAAGFLERLVPDLLAKRYPHRAPPETRPDPPAQLNRRKSPRPA